MRRISRFLFNDAPVDPGRATIIAARIGFFATIAGGILGVVGVKLAGPDLQSVIDQQTDRISKLEKDLASENADLIGIKNELAVCQSSVAKLNAQLVAEQEKVTVGAEGELDCSAERDSLENERETWNLDKNRLEQSLQRTSIELRQTGEKLEASEERNKVLERQILQFSSRRNRVLDLAQAYENIELSLEALNSKSLDLSSESSTERLMAFQREVMKNLGRIDGFRMEYGEVEYYFNAEIQVLYERLLERDENGQAPLEAEVMQRRLSEALKAFRARQKVFESELRQLLEAEGELAPFNEELKDPI